jgi:hypothetical protein
LKNPFLSFWLSQANAWSGAMRGFWAGELQRQQTQMVNQMVEQSLRFWSGAWMLPTAPGARRERRRADGR